MIKNHKLVFLKWHATRTILLQRAKILHARSFMQKEMVGIEKETKKFSL